MEAFDVVDCFGWLQNWLCTASHSSISNRNLEAWNLCVECFGEKRNTNFIESHFHTGAQRRAAELGLALVTMDTSPRGLGVEGESDSWDFGVGAGFYVNATQDKWKNWQMFDFVTKVGQKSVSASTRSLSITCALV